VIVLHKENTLQNGMIVYPIFPKSGYAAEKALTDFLDILKSTNHSIAYGILSKQENDISTTISGTVSGKKVAGYAGVSKSENTYIIYLSWTSPENFSAENQSFSRCVIKSYRKTVGRALVRLKSPNGYFETVAPAGWKIEDSANGATISHPDNEAGVFFSYVDFGGDPRAMTPDRAFNEFINLPCKSPGKPMTGEVCNILLQKPAGVFGTIRLPDFRDIMGRIWKTRGDEYEALLADNKTYVHGTTVVSVMDGQHVTGLHGYMIIVSTRLSSPANWPKYSAITDYIQSKMRVVRASEFITDRILPRNNMLDFNVITGWWNAKNARESERSANLQDAIMGFESYRTSSGTQYDVPLNSISYGNHPVYVEEQTGLLWNSITETPPLRYVPLIRDR
jgi:hypothetical protein